MEAIVRRARVSLALLGLALAAPAGAQSGPWAVPAEGACQAPPPRGVRAEDAGRFPFRSGDVVSMERLPAARAYFPEAVWERRDVFFHDGMRLEIGPCYRNYAPPRFFEEVTARGRTRLTEDGGIEGHRAGLPFAPASIDAGDPRAGEKWAWNAALRYRGAGFRGKFRVTDLSGGAEQPDPFEGEIFHVMLARRADLADDGYRVPFARDELWVAGGTLQEPFRVRDLAWRQYRPMEALQDAERSDEVHAYLPDLRRVRRMPSARVEGLFVPSFGAGTVPNQQLAVGGGGAGSVGSGGAGPGAGAVSSGGGEAGGGAQGLGSAPAGIGTNVDAMRNGFEDLVIRPNLWRWTLVGVRDVLAPIHATRPMYPEDPDRGFGPSGLSLDDRYDLRRAIVLEARRDGDRRPSDDPRARTVYYFDLQTLFPLYSVVYGADGEVLGVTMHAGRWSEDRAGYPRWPDDPARPVRVVDSVASVYAAGAPRGSWRRESWTMVSTPPSDEQLQAMYSVSALERHD